jgi:glutamate dehydrogenase/leucine dehydrogenase
MLVAVEPDLPRPLQHIQEFLAFVLLNSRVDMRTAAHMIAIQRVANATTVRGLYP